MYLRIIVKKELTERILFNVNKASEAAGLLPTNETRIEEYWKFRDSNEIGMRFLPKKPLSAKACSDFFLNCFGSCDLQYNDGTHLCFDRYGQRDNENERVFAVMCIPIEYVSEK